MIIFLGQRSLFRAIIYVEDTSDGNARGCTRDSGTDDEYYGDRREPSGGEKEKGRCHVLRQRALLERTSSAGNEPNRANFGDFNASTSSLSVSSVPRQNDD